MVSTRPPTSPSSASSSDGAAGGGGTSGGNGGGSRSDMPMDVSSMESVGSNTSFADPPDYPTGAVVSPSRDTASSMSVSSTSSSSTSSGRSAAAVDPASSAFLSSVFTPVAPTGAPTAGSGSPPTSFSLRITVLDKKTMGSQPQPTPPPHPPPPAKLAAVAAAINNGVLLSSSLPPFALPSSATHLPPVVAPAKSSSSSSSMNDSKYHDLDPNLLTPPIDLSNIPVEWRDESDFQVIGDLHHLGYARRRRDLPVNSFLPLPTLCFDVAIEVRLMGWMSIAWNNGTTRSSHDVALRDTTP
jgi:hypothetical protein